MKLLFSLLDDPLAIQDGETLEIIIENQKVFRETIEDLKNQLEGENGSLIISISDKPVTAKKHIELIDSLCPFDINTKQLLNKVYSVIETSSISELNYVKNQELLSLIEQYLDRLGEDNGLYLEYSKLSMDSIIRAVGARVSIDYVSPLEAIIDYMELMNGFDGEKIYFFINLRSYFNDDEILGFVQTINSKGLIMVLLESSERKRVEGTRRILIDSDLCVI